MEQYFNAWSAISPVASCENETFELRVPVTEKVYFTALEPDYKSVIDKKHLRRMSKFIKMSVANAFICLKEANIEQPDAILTATGLGCTADTIEFLQQLIEYRETLLNPTAFMQSTHNTASGQIALLLGCRSFNLTFTQKNTSFESALLQSQMMLNSGEYVHILLGGTDEITPQSYALMAQTDCFNPNGADQSYLPGEGAAFFMLTSQQSMHNKARLDALSFIPGNLTPDQFNQAVDRFLLQNHTSIDGVDFILTGAPKEEPTNPVFNKTIDLSKLIWFKDYCGAYDTSSSFALWLALELMENRVETHQSVNPSKILIHNQGTGFQHTLMLISKC